jgi:hypothetical protein
MKTFAILAASLLAAVATATPVPDLDVDMAGLNAEIKRNAIPDLEVNMGGVNADVKRDVTPDLDLDLKQVPIANLIAALVDKLPIDAKVSALPDGL